MAADVLESMMALLRHRTIGRAVDTRDLRADRMQMVEVVALTAAPLAAAYIGVVVMAGPAQIYCIACEKRPGNRREGKTSSFSSRGYREDGVQHSRRCYRHSQ